MQVYYCSQHCQQKHWDKEHRHTCLVPRATLRPVGCNPLPRKKYSSAHSDSSASRENRENTCIPQVGR